MKTHASSCILRWLNMYNFCLFRALNNLLLYKSQVEHSIVSSGLISSTLASGREPPVQSCIRIGLDFHCRMHLCQIGWAWILGKFTLEKLHGAVWRHVYLFLNLPNDEANCAELSLKVFVLATEKAFKRWQPVICWRISGSRWSY